MTRLMPTTGSPITTTPVRRELRRNDWGYNISGPVVKNKLFIWWNQEWNREIRGTSEAACVPTVAEEDG